MSLLGRAQGVIEENMEPVEDAIRGDENRNIVALGGFIDFIELGGVRPRDEKVIFFQ